MRPHASAALLAAWLLGCGGAGSSPSPAPQRVHAGTQDESGPEPAADAPTALPADLPERLEIEVRRRTEDGADRVLKLTPAGARYGLAHAEARIALRYLLPQGAIEPVYATFREEGCDGLQTEPREGAPLRGGTSLRVSTGTETYTATAMGRQQPIPEHADAYARCLAAAEALVPAGRTDVVVRVRWDASMRGRSAGLDVDVGTDLAGLHRVPAPPRAAPDGAVAAADREPVPPLEPPLDVAPPLHVVELHLARARPLQLQLRQGASEAAAEGAGPTSRSTTLTVRAGVDRGVEVAFDAARGEVVLRPLAHAIAPAPAAP